MYFESKTGLELQGKPEKNLNLGKYYFNIQKSFKCMKKLTTYQQITSFFNKLSYEALCKPFTCYLQLSAVQKLA